MKGPPTRVLNIATLLLALLVVVLMGPGRGVGGGAGQRHGG